LSLSPNPAKSPSSATIQHGTREKLAQGEISPCAKLARGLHYRHGQGSKDPAPPTHPGDELRSAVYPPRNLPPRRPGLRLLRALSRGWSQSHSRPPPTLQRRRDQPPEQPGHLLQQVQQQPRHSPGCHVRPRSRGVRQSRSDGRRDCRARPSDRPPHSAPGSCPRDDCTPRVCCPRAQDTLTHHTTPTHEKKMGAQ